MANKTIKVSTKDADGNTKLQEIIGWNNNNVPAIAVIGMDPKSRIPVKNGIELTVNDAIIKASDGREYYYIAAGSHKGKYVKKEDVK